MSRKSGNVSTVTPPRACNNVTGEAFPRFPTFPSGDARTDCYANENELTVLARARDAGWVCVRALALGPAAAGTLILMVGGMAEGSPSLAVPRRGRRLLLGARASRAHSLLHAAAIASICSLVVAGTESAPFLKSSRAASWQATRAWSCSTACAPTLA